MVCLRSIPRLARRRLAVRWTDVCWAVEARRPMAQCALAMLKGERRHFMKTQRPIALRRGFTLIELLVVISIIGILAAMLLPALGAAKMRTQKAKAQVEVRQIITAISQYEADYHRYPSSTFAREIGAENDFTYGTYHATADGQQRRLARRGHPQGKYGLLEEVFTPKGAARRDYRTSNAEVMAILRDVEQFRDGNKTVNSGHALNPQKNVYLDVKETDQTTQGGMSPDGIYRDPWGNPYIISMDLNGDQKCRDAFYALGTVSSQGGRQGFNGLVSTSGNPTGPFEANTGLMVWSFGPDSTVNAQQKANAGANKDNVLSW